MAVLGFIRSSTRNAVVMIIAAALAIGLATGAAHARQYDEKHHLIIGLDLSKSNPLVDDPNFAAKVARRVFTLLRDLPVRSKVTLRTFGVASVSSNPIELDWEIDTQRSSNRAVARIVTRITAGVPELVKSGRFEAQNWTNIIDFLQTMIADKERIDCAAMPTIFVLATDGFEDSVYGKLRTPGAKLPKPAGRRFDGCKELLMLGIGQGRRANPRVTERLHREWSGWAQAAGFQRFVGLSSW